MGVGRLVSTKNWSFSGSMFIYHRVIPWNPDFFQQIPWNSIQIPHLGKTPPVSFELSPCLRWSKIPATLGGAVWRIIHQCREEFLQQLGFGPVGMPRTRGLQHLEIFGKSMAIAISWEVHHIYIAQMLHAWMIYLHKNPKNDSVF